MISILVVAGVVVVIIGAIPGVRRSGEVTWLHALLKSMVVFLGATLLTVLIPSYVLKREDVAGLDRTYQDLIGLTLWSIALVAVLSLLRYAQRRDRI